MEEKEIENKPEENGEVNAEAAELLKEVKIPEEEPRQQETPPAGGRARLLKITAGITAFSCAAIAILSVVILYFVILPSSDSVAVTFGTFILGMLYAIVMAAVSLSCILSGILILVSGKRGGAIFGVINVLGIFDIVAIIGTILISTLTGKISAGWFVVFAIPFAADFAMRILCAVFCKNIKEND